MADEVITETPEADQASIEESVIETSEAAPVAEEVVDVTEDVTESSSKEETEPETFPAHVVKELREENARRRTQLRAYEEKFEGWEDERKAAWFELGASLESNPEEAVGVLRALADRLGGEAGEELEELADEVEESADVEVDETTEVLDEKSLEEKVSALFAAKQAEIAEKETQIEEKAELVKIDAELRELGYDVAKPSPEQGLLWHFVANQPEGKRDLKAAHAAVQSFIQERIDAAFEEAKSGKGSTPPRVDAGTNPGESQEPETMESARKKLREALGR